MLSCLPSTWNPNSIPQRHTFKSNNCNANFHIYVCRYNMYNSPYLTYKTQEKINWYALYVLLCAYDNKFNSVPFHMEPLQWCHNECDGISKSPVSQLFAQMFVQVLIKEIMKALRHWEGNHQYQEDFPHKGTVTQKMSPFDDGVMIPRSICYLMQWIECSICTVSPKVLGSGKPRQKNHHDI